jgi:hypothetical protein
VVVAVGVGDRDEPQLGRVDQPGERAVAAVAVDHVAREPADHLRRDPLARVLGADVEDRRPTPVTQLRGPPRHLQGDDVLALDGLADGDQLGDGRVVGGQPLELVLSPPPVPYGRNTVYPSAASRVAASRVVGAGESAAAVAVSPLVTMLAAAMATHILRLVAVPSQVRALGLQ